MKTIIGRRKHQGEAEMRKWCQINGKKPEVKLWLKNHPVPEDWQGTALEYAYTEMPAIQFFF